MFTSRNSRYCIAFVAFVLPTVCLSQTSPATGADKPTSQDPTALVPPPLAASQSTIPAISPDRPTFSDSTSLALKGHLEFDSGISIFHVPGSTTNSYGSLLTRYGLTDKLEVRVANVSWTQMTGQSSGFQDPLVGVKFWLQTGSAKRPDLAGEIVTTVPIGAASYRVNRTQPTAKFLWNQQLDPKTTLTGDLIVSDLGPYDARFTQYAAGTYLTRSIDAKLSVFGEIYGLAPISHGGPNGAFYDFGASYLISNNLEVDALLGWGFDASRDGRLISVGISYRL